MELITTTPKEDGKWLLLYGEYADERDDRHTGFIQGYWLDDFNGWYTQCGFPINATKWVPLPSENSQAETLETTVTEQQYSVISDLATIRAATAILRNVVPDCYDGAVSKDEWQTVMQTLLRWDAALNELVHSYETK